MTKEEAKRTNDAVQLWNGIVDNMQLIEESLVALQNILVFGIDTSAVIGDAKHVFGLPTIKYGKADVLIPRMLDYVRRRRGWIYQRLSVTEAVTKLLTIKEKENGPEAKQSGSSRSGK